MGRAEHIRVFTTKTEFWYIYEDSVREKQFPKEADELFAAAQENAQWRYKSYLRMLGTAW